MAKVAAEKKVAAEEKAVAKPSAPVRRKPR
jgi:hypothetical protein